MKPPRSRKLYSSIVIVGTAIAGGGGVACSGSVTCGGSAMSCIDSALQDVAHIDTAVAPIDAPEEPFVWHVDVGLPPDVPHIDVGPAPDVQTGEAGSDAEAGDPDAYDIATIDVGAANGNG